MGPRYGNGICHTSCGIELTVPPVHLLFHVKIATTVRLYSSFKLHPVQPVGAD